MKKLFLLFLMALTFTMVKAQTYRYNATSFAYKAVNSYGYWTNWTDWESCNVPIVMDYDNDVVTIYSNKTQIYRITKYIRKYTDSSGGSQVEFNFVDQDYDKGVMRLRIERNGNSQMYIDFANIMWVYNVRRVR